MTICPECDETKRHRVTIRSATEHQPAYWKTECRICGTTWEGEPGSEPQHIQRRTRHQIHGLRKPEDRRAS